MRGGRRGLAARAEFQGRLELDGGVVVLVAGAVVAGVGLLV